MTGIKRPLVQDLPYSSTPCSIADPIEAGGVHLRAVVSPSWSSQQDNYDAGFAFAIRANVGVPCDLTGIEASTSHGRRLLIVNAGSASLTIKNESGSSTAVNRFALSADLVLAAGNSAELWYDETSTRWRAISAPSTGGGGGSSDHGALTGLSDDDHTQYHNNARGDARYSQLGHTHTRTITIGATFDGGGAALVAGAKCYVRVPVACTIVEATALTDVSGSVVVDVWKDTYANYPPTDADSITAAAPITISSGTKSTDATLTGWDTAIAAGDVVAFHIDSCSAIKQLHIQLKAGYSA